MLDIKVATAQFEPRDNQPEFNLQRIKELTAQAVERGAQIVSFHECCLHGYSWVQSLSLTRLQAIAEPVPDGAAVRGLMKIAKEFGVIVMAGLFEKDATGAVYNCYVTVGPEGFLTRFRKLHPFINPHLSPGSCFEVIELAGCKIGFLICYDNNLPENVRVTTMLGAEVIMMPHVTGGLPSVMPGRGKIDRRIWDNRRLDPVRLRQEFRGPKGRQWLLKWLPARAWENGVYCVFSNPIGWDHDSVKPGLAMVVDPFGEIQAESHQLEDDVVVTTLSASKVAQASGRRYLRARRPDLYGKLVEPQESMTEPGWKLDSPDQ
jgi:predicted amidohydrolase